jgi:hypothetical protein
MNEQARVFASRLRTECGDDTDAQVRRAYLLALGRSATKQEIAQAKNFLAIQSRLVGSEQVAERQKASGQNKLATAAALADFCLALLNCNEFLYVN